MPEAVPAVAPATPAVPAVATPQAAATPPAAAPIAAAGPVGTDSPWAKAPETPKSNVPEKGYEWKLPEGRTLDKAVLEKYSSFAKEQNFTQEQAQKFLERDLSERETYHAEAVKQARADLAKQDGLWQEELKKDSEFGGVAGGSYTKNAELATRAFNVGDPDGSFRAALKEAGLVNHPGLLKFVARIGRGMAEDTLATPAAGGKLQEKTLEQKLYPTMNKK